MLICPNAIDHVSAAAVQLAVLAARDIVYPDNRADQPIPLLNGNISDPAAVRRPSRIVALFFALLLRFTALSSRHLSVYPRGRHASQGDSC
jgi:hypothetical protein